MTEGYASLDAHAYVDQSLKPGDRDAFEAALRRDPKLRARVEAWEAQNEAIRLAFGAAPRARAPSLGRPGNENVSKPRVSELAPPRSRPVAVRFETLAPQRELWPTRALAFGVALVVGLLGFAGGSSDPRAAMIARAQTALRASAYFPEARLDLVSDNPAALSAWLGGRFGHYAPERLLPPGWSLLGVRIVPGVAEAAAMVLYEDALGGRAALLLEPTDALPERAASVARDEDEATVAGVTGSVLYAAVGPRRSGVGALVPRDAR